MNTPPSSSSFDRDLLRYAEGSLSDEELALFQVRLAAEPALRNDLRTLAEQAFAIHFGVSLRGGKIGVTEQFLNRA